MQHESGRTVYTSTINSRVWRLSFID